MNRWAEPYKELLLERVKEMMEINHCACHTRKLFNEDLIALLSPEQTDRERFGAGRVDVYTRMIEVAGGKGFIQKTYDTRKKERRVGKERKGIKVAEWIYWTEFGTSSMHTLKIDLRKEDRRKA